MRRTFEAKLLERMMTEQLDELRREIDLIDGQIIQALGRRFELCRQVARLKKNERIPMMQPGRVEAVKKRCMDLGIQHGLDPDLIKDLYTLIINKSCIVETEIIESSSDERS
jgi:4-amino-4-deoxychorismate mutase